MPHIPIIPDREYLPSEIVEYKFILNTKGKPDYRYVLRLIKYGKLRAKNICNGTKGKIFKVQGSDIIAWKKTTIATDYYKPDPIENSRYTFRNRPFPQAE